MCGMFRSAFRPVPFRLVPFRPVPFRPVPTRTGGGAMFKTTRLFIVLRIIFVLVFTINRYFYRAISSISGFCTDSSNLLVKNCKFRGQKLHVAQ